MAEDGVEGAASPRFARVAAMFEDRFGGAPTRVSRAPGRVNLIGDHIDYHGGVVLPLALSLDTVVMFRPSGNGSSCIWSHGHDEPACFDASRSPAAPVGDWRRYVVAIAAALADDGVRVPGIEAVVHGTVPEGGGLSSSASLLVALAAAFLDAAGASIKPVQLWRTARLAEHRLGVWSGLMDFIAAIEGGIGGPLMIDCSIGGRHRVVDAPDGVAWRVSLSGVKHDLSASGYNARVAECAEAQEQLGVARLLDPDVRDDAIARLPAPLGNRVRHVRSEHARVLAFCDALRAGDTLTMGALMNESHASLRDDYAVSCPEIETLVVAALEVDGVHGTRITGGGFGGATVTLLDTDAIDTFDHHVATRYHTAHGANPRFIDATPGAGVEVRDAPPRG